jgi:AraC-like DNA-binding protein
MFTIDQIDRQALRSLVDNADELAIDIAALLRQLGIVRSLKDVRSQNVTFDEYLRLQRALTGAIRTALHGLMGQRAFRQEEYEVSLHYMLGADDLAGALARMKFFASMFPERFGNGAIHLSIDQPSVAKLYIRFGIDAELQQRFAGHFLREELKLFEMLSWLIGESIELISAELPFTACAELEPYLGRLRCPVHYGSRGFGFFFSRALLHKPIVRSMDELRSFLRIYEAVFVDSGHERLPLDQRIERVLEKQALEGSGMPSATQLASALNMSAATLRRHLQGSGRSFSEIKRACQIRLGKKLLALPSRNLYDIAQQLGYQDVNAFRRAFRQSAGQTPECFRKSCSADAAAGAAEKQRAPAAALFAASGAGLDKASL